MVYYMKLLIIKDICGVCFFLLVNLCNLKRLYFSMLLFLGGGGFCWIGLFRVYKVIFYFE